MNIEQLKALAKEKLNLDITDEQAEEWLAEHKKETLTEGELADVSGGVTFGDLRNHTGIALERTKDESEEPIYGIWHDIPQSPYGSSAYRDKVHMDKLIKKILSETEK